MKVVLVNGSPHKNGCTNRALQEVTHVLSDEGVEVKNFWIGAKPVSGCMGCKKCARDGKCVLNDVVNEFHALADAADGYVFGTPVHFAGANGAMTSFMDRVFYSELSSGNHHFRLKPAAAVVSARRAGTTSAFDRLNKYFTVLEMPVISSSYWNMVHGYAPADVEKDLEGLRTMRVLGRNMTYFLKCQAAGKKAGVAFPEKEPGIETNFIRE